VRVPLPDRRAVLATEGEDCIAASNFPSKDSFHTFKLYLRADHCHNIALVEAEIIGFYELGSCEVDLDRLAGGQPQDYVRPHTTADGTLTVQQMSSVTNELACLWKFLFGTI